jgi:hypothetical protein
VGFWGAWFFSCMGCGLNWEGGLTDNGSSVTTVVTLSDLRGTSKAGRPLITPSHRGVHAASEYHNEDLRANVARSR